MEDQEEIRIRYPKKGEVIGIIEALLGAKKFRVRCLDGKTRLCRIPGRIRKRLNLRENFVVLVEIWQLQGDNHGDIIYIYSNAEREAMQRKGII